MSDHLTRSAPPNGTPTADPDATRDPGGPVFDGPAPPVGERYVLGEEIARGGMGVVYRATDAAFGREVAVKVLQDRFGPGSAAARRFLDEARITGQLQHPGIPPVYDRGVFPGGRPFLAMKLIKGRTLDDLLREGEAPAEPPSLPDPRLGGSLALPKTHLVPAFEGVCQAVGYAHAHGVIHRDLKPQNVMVGAFGEVQVMDWGLAKVLAGGGREVPELADDEPTRPGTTIDPLRGDADATQAGSVLGTVAFMPPEQAIGAVDQVDARSDVFGLGAILCVILTGKPPYAGETPESTRQLSARAKLDDAWARLDGCGADPGLAALCRKCLSPERADRPANGGEVAREVARLRADADERAKQAELDRVRAEGDLRAAGVAAVEQRRRRRVQMALAGAIGLLVVGGGAAGWWVDKQAEARRAEERDRRAAAEREVNRAVEEAATALGRATGAGLDPVFWAEARAAARVAEELAATADVPVEVRDRARVLVAGAVQGEKNRRLVAALRDIQAGMGDDLNAIGGQNYIQADARYAAAFRAYGVDPFALTPKVAADLLGRLGGDIRVELAAALDDWAYVRPSALFQSQAADQPRDRAGWYRSSAPLARLTQQLDPDPVRNRLRDAVGGGDMDAVGRVAARLAEEVDPAAHPARTVNLIAVFMPWGEPRALEAAVRFLHRAQPHHPGDFQINHNLAFFLIRQRRYADALPFAAAAVAVRPHSGAAWDDWARESAGVGRVSDAVIAHRRVYALSPENLSSRVWVVELLTRAGDRHGAAAARAELNRLAVDPAAVGWAYAQLADDLWARDDLGWAVEAFAEAARLLPKNPHLSVRLDHVRRLQAERTAPPPRERKP